MKKVTGRLFECCTKSCVAVWQVSDEGKGMLRRALMRRRAASVRHTASHQHGGRWLQGQALAESDGVAEESSAVGDHREETQSTTARATVPTPIATAMALAEQLKHPESSRIGRTITLRPEWLPNGADWGLSTEHITRAKSWLLRLKERVDNDYQPRKDAASSPRSEEDLHVLKQKGMTSRLGRMLVAMLRRKQYREMEAIALLWEDVFPEFARNPKHLSVICEHYATSLLRQKRCSEIVEMFFTTWRDNADQAQSEMLEAMILTPQVMGCVLRACGYLNDVSTAVEVLRVARERGIRLHHDVYFHLLDELLRDNPVETYDDAIRICDVLVQEMNSTVPQPIVPILLRTSIARGDLRRALEFYTPPTGAIGIKFAEFHLDVSILAMWDAGVSQKIVLLLQDVLESQHVKPATKASVAKGLLRKVVDESDPVRREIATKVAMAILDLMERHRIRANIKVVPGLLNVLMDELEFDTVDEFVAFFDKYPHVIEWNASVLCEVVLGAVRRRHGELIDELVVHALDTGIPIKYVALESVVAFFYRTGKFDSVEKAAKIIRAMRLNHHMPLGMALTEIGMMCNLKLGRYEEVSLLFEDFSTRDSEAQRVLDRRPMLFAAAEAYEKLRRYHEANAVKQIIKQHHLSTQPCGRSDDGSDDDEGDDAEYDGGRLGRSTQDQR